MEAATATEAMPFEGGGTRPLDRLRSDRRLAERFRAGDDGAFHSLYERHRGRVYAICLGVLGSPEDAQDALQETFVSAARSMPADPPSDLRPWLGRVARNAAIDIARKRRPVVVAPDVEALAPPRDDPDVAVHEVLAGLRELPERQRSALVMRELAGFSYAEIATTLGVDESAVTGLIARARTSLRKREESLSLACGSVRDRLASESDGRRRPAEVRRHLRACEGCRDFQASVRADGRALRALAPGGGGLALWQLLAAWRGGRALVAGGVVAKGALGGGGIKLAAVCALCVGTAGGLAEVTGHLPGSGSDEQRAEARGRAAERAAPERAAGVATAPAPDRLAMAETAPVLERARRRAAARERALALSGEVALVESPEWLRALPEEMRHPIEAERLRQAEEHGERAEEWRRRQEEMRRAEEDVRRDREERAAAPDRAPPTREPRPQPPPSYESPEYRPAPSPEPPAGAERWEPGDLLSPAAPPPPEP